MVNDATSEAARSDSSVSLLSKASSTFKSKYLNNYINKAKTSPARSNHSFIRDNSIDD